MYQTDLEKQMQGYGLTSVRILYHMPDHPNLLQEFLWQTHDLAPHFPRLTKFVDFWKREIEGRLHKVEYAHKELIGPNEWRSVDGVLTIH